MICEEYFECLVKLNNYAEWDDKIFLDEISCYSYNYSGASVSIVTDENKFYFQLDFSIPYEAPDTEIISLERAKEIIEKVEKGR